MHHVSPFPTRHTPFPHFPSPNLPLPTGKARAVAKPIPRFDPAPMLVTLTTNMDGHQRLYLGGASSLETWLEKAPDGRHWTFHTNDGLAAADTTDDERRATAAHRLATLCDMLGCTPDQLRHVPFAVIASLHNGNPRENRRMATPRRDLAEHAYVATDPHMRRPRADFRREDFEQFRHR